MRWTGLTLAVLLSACAHAPVKHASTDEHAFWTRKVYTVISEQAQAGDWLVIRGYKATDQLVVNATNMPFSHAAIIDLANDRVIESEQPRVHASKMHEFIDEAHHVVLIRPRWANEQTREIAVQSAISTLGKPYDLFGTIGLNAKNAYYCSELVVAVYQPWQSDQDKIPRIIKPGDLHRWGEVVFDSKPRPN